MATNLAYYEDITYSNNGKIKCDLCKLEVADSNYFIDLHLNEKDHKDLYIKRSMIQNNILLNGNRKCCFICGINIQMSVLSHIESVEHQNRIRRIKDLVEKDGNWLELPRNISEIGTLVYCPICNKLLEFSLKAIEDHIETTQHKRARAIVLQHYNGIFTVEGSNDDLWCKVCRVYLENYIEIIFKHIDEDREHIRSLQKITGLIEGENIDIEIFLTDATEDKAYCNKCKTKVSCNVDNLERHIKGRTHNQEEKK